MSHLESSARIHHEAEPEQLFLVYINDEASDDPVVEAELEGLIEAVGGEVAGTTRQRVTRPTKATFVGSGKAIEIAAAAEELGADAIVFDCELTGIQIRNLEQKAKRRVLDRTTLILDIFARRARSREGQLQVELAQLTYRLPRLMSVYTKFERQRGGIGMRGPGETKLESDRRMVRDRIARLKDEIEHVRQHRELQREGRRDQPYPFVAIVGYTSAGKSTLMNRLASTDLLADAMPFATLDPTTRKIDLPDGDAFFLSDTVGFIRNLPTLLVAAFRATLEELLFSDLLLHVVDVSHPAWEMQHDSVIETIEALKAQDVPMLTVFNKIDAAPDRAEMDRRVADWPDSVAISALTGEGINDLLEAIRRRLCGRLEAVRVLVPYDQAHLAEKAHDMGRVRVKEYREDGVFLVADVVPELSGKLRRFSVED